MTERDDLYETVGRFRGIGLVCLFVALSTAIQLIGWAEHQRPGWLAVGVALAASVFSYAMSWRTRGKAGKAQL